MDKAVYFRFYKEVLKNAQNLCDEAKLLFENKYFARAYVLAFTGLEEVRKSQLAGDVFTGFENEEEYKILRHQEKIQGVKWAHTESTVGNEWRIIEEMTGIEFSKIPEPSFEMRQGGLYVDLDKKNGTFNTPNELISEDDAYGIIHILEVALTRIHEVTEEWGHQIGTKGFMK